MSWPALEISLSLCQGLFNYFVEEKDLRVSTLFATVGTVGLLAGSLVVGQVHADDTTVTVSDAATAIASVSAVIGASAPETKTADGFVANINGSTVELPKDPSDGISMIDPQGVTVTMGLPLANSADDGVKARMGTVVYADAAPDTAVAAQATSDGGVRALVVIDGPAAPAEYRFPLTLPDGSTLTTTPEGGVLALSPAGIPELSVGAPWAKDANGHDVNTYYRIEATTIVQVVDHQGASYPVVADPFVTDCSWTYATCSIYVNRGTVHNMAAILARYPNSANTYLAGATAAAACLAVSGPAAVLCGLAAGFYMGFLEDQINYADRVNKCIRFRFLNPMWTWTISVPLIYVDGSSWCHN